LGCGRGDQTINWNGKIGASELNGVEISWEAARAAKEKGVDVVVCDANRPLPFIDNAFDVVISNQVIEHLANVDVSLSEVNRVLKDSGYAVVSTENLASWHNIVALLFGLRPFSLHYSSVRDVGNPFSPHEAELMNSVVHEDSPHIKVFAYYALTSVLQLHNFRIDVVKGAGNYMIPLLPLSRILSRLDPVHSHLLTCRLRKNRRLPMNSRAVSVESSTQLLFS
jgi:SAM-dependent methyltransferase